MDRLGPVSSGLCRPWAGLCGQAAERAAIKVTELASNHFRSWAASLPFAHTRTVLLLTGNPCFNVQFPLNTEYAFSSKSFLKNASVCLHGGKDTPYPRRRLLFIKVLPALSFASTVQRSRGCIEVCYSSPYFLLSLL